MVKIREMSKTLKSSSSESTCKIPEVKDSGQLVLVNSHKIEAKASKIELNEDNSELLSYMIIP